MSLRERLGLEHPVVQAGMGGGLSRGRLAGAVSAAGGLGTVGILGPDELRAEVAAARERADGRPVAANLLLPFARRTHRDAVAGADVVVTFWGAPQRPTDRVWLHQAGSVDEARKAVAAGADGVVVQGVEAGGHVRGTTPAFELLAQVRAAVGDGTPLWLAGGVADRTDVQRALDAGADAAVAGTRFLLTEESHAHPGYKARATAGSETLLTMLFGAGWPAPHRVLPNRATERWLREDERGPGPLRALHRATAAPLSKVSIPTMVRVARTQRPWMPLLGPAAACEGDPGGLLDAGPLYAGQTVARITDVVPAADAVRALSPAG
ncbi:nitronate monooxygenase family protein [Conexibacter sp. SYSU D00693]|uniref:NAD(P)H-dependent flavin oxidoreductase n=1 Tax=Conexibacter sp. SYSU D00693 TaxID=2812560 RepID=UPI00196A64E8|nr:nitronate monooxygenase [Conexibacter sp. SYSU D00693]